MITSEAILESVMEGGDWLSTLRKWIQRKKINGSKVTWGTADVLEPPMAIREVEEATAQAVAADRERTIVLMLEVCGHKEHLVGCTWCIMARMIHRGKHIQRKRDA